MPIKKPELVEHLKKIGVTKEGIAYVLRVHNKFAPSRRANGLFGCVHDTYASRKNGFTVNSESRHYEAPFILWCELNKNVLIYWDQPEKIKTTFYKGDRKTTILTTEDVLVIENDKAYLVECKPHRVMQKLASESPERYCRTEHGFSCPPAIETCQKTGMGHRIVTELDFSVNFVRNCYFLLEFIDQQVSVNDHIIEKVKIFIETRGNRVTLQLLQKEFSQETVFSLILENTLFFDADFDLLHLPDRCYIYASKYHLEAINLCRKNNALIQAKSILDLEFQPYLWIKSIRYTIASFSPEDKIAVTAQSDTGTLSFPKSEIRSLIEREDIYVSTPIDEASQAAIGLLKDKSVRQIELALRRLEIAQSNSPPKSVSERTYYRLKKQFRQAQEDFGDGFLGLVDNSDKQGNHQCRLIDENIELIEHFFNQALKPSPGPLKFYFDEYVREAENQCIPPVSLKTFYQRFIKFDSIYERTRKQKGQRAAYSLGPQPRELSFEKEIPYDGDFAFQIAHIDHSPIEMEFKSGINDLQFSGSLQLSIMFDAFSKMILAIHASFEKPSYRATMMLLRECYRRHGVLPLMIVYDRGADFESKYNDEILAALGVHKRRRPVGASRHGSGIERCFGTSETELIHSLEGNKQLQKLGRSLSSTHNPKKFASWSPSGFYIALKEYAYHTYPETIRSSICDSPLNRFNRSLSTFDKKPGTKVNSEQAFYLATMPIKKTNNGYCTLTENQLTFRRIRYRLEQPVPGYEGGKLKVLVKYDPYNVRHIWAKIGNRWAQLTTHDSLIRECIDKGINFPHLEVYPLRLRQNKLYRTGKHKPVIPVNSPDLNTQPLTLSATSCGAQKKREKISIDLCTINTPRTETIKGNDNGY